MTRRLLNFRNLVSVSSLIPYLCPMILLWIILFIIALYLLVPKSTLLHELLRVPGYNYKAQTAPRNNMQMEKHSFGKHRKQYLYFFSPKDKPISKDKIILYYHGGGWTFGTPMMFRCNAQLFVDQGYAVVMPSYRRLPFYRCPDMQEDARLALNKTIELIKNKGLGDKQLILSGLSAGGHLAAIIAYDEKQWQMAGVSRNLLAGLMLFAPPVDLTKMSSTPVIWRLAGWRNSDLFKASNPVNFVKPLDTLPLLLIHGTKDGLVNYKSSISFIEKRGSQQLTFHSLDNGTHLDAGNWIFEKGETQAMVFAWLKSL